MSGLLHCNQQSIFHEVQKAHRIAMRLLNNPLLVALTIAGHNIESLEAPNSLGSTRYHMVEHLAKHYPKLKQSNPQLKLEQIINHGLNLPNKHALDVFILGLPDHHRQQAMMLLSHQQPHTQPGAAPAA